jgi:hypothetical protein
MQGIVGNNPCHVLSRQYYIHANHPGSIFITEEQMDSGIRRNDEYLLGWGGE